MPKCTVELTVQECARNYLSSSSMWYSGVTTVRLLEASKPMGDSTNNWIPSTGVGCSHLGLTGPNPRSSSWYHSPTRWTGVSVVISDVWVVTCHIQIEAICITAVICLTGIPTAVLGLLGQTLSLSHVTKGLAQGRCVWVDSIFSSKDKNGSNTVVCELRMCLSLAALGRKGLPSLSQRIHGLSGDAAWGHDHSKGELNLTVQGINGDCTHLYVISGMLVWCDQVCSSGSHCWKEKKKKNM